MCKIFSLAPSCRSQLPLFQILQIGARFKMPCQAQFKSTWPICRCVPSQSQLGVIFYECKTPRGSSGFGSFDCTIRLRKGGGRGELLPRCGHSSSHCSPDLGRGGEDLRRRATCVNCRLLPLRTVSSHSLLQTDKRGRCDLTPIVNWQLIMQLTHSHQWIHQGQGTKTKTKRETKTKTKTTMVFLSSDTRSLKKGKAYQESCENSRKQKRRRITTELTNLKFLYWECQDNTRQRNEFLDNGTRKRENLGL